MCTLAKCLPIFYGRTKVKMFSCNRVFTLATTGTRTGAG